MATEKSLITIHLPHNIYRMRDNIAEMLPDDKLCPVCLRDTLSPRVETGNNPPRVTAYGIECVALDCSGYKRMVSTDEP